MDGQFRLTLPNPGGGAYWHGMANFFVRMLIPPTGLTNWSTANKSTRRLVIPPGAAVQLAASSLLLLMPHGASFLSLPYWDCGSNFRLVMSNVASHSLHTLQIGETCFGDIDQLMLDLHYKVRCWMMKAGAPLPRVFDNLSSSREQWMVESMSLLTFPSTTTTTTATTATATSAATSHSPPLLPLPPPAIVSPLPCTVCPPIFPVNDPSRDDDFPIFPVDDPSSDDDVVRWRCLLRMFMPVCHRAMAEYFIIAT